MPNYTRDDNVPNVTIETSNFDELKTYYDEILNTDKSTYTSSNDEPTPIDCVLEMISQIPTELWRKDDLSIVKFPFSVGVFFFFF